MAMSVLDSSVTNIALPTIATDLASDPANSVWVVTAYQIAIVMGLLPAAALGERYGYRHVYVGGLLLFVAMSLACAWARSLTFLAAARFMQGLGAAGMMGVNGALIRHVWPKAMLGRGIGYNAMVIACTAAAGPALGGLILAYAAWPWLFMINIPVGMAALLLSLRYAPRSPAETDRFDVIEAVLSAAMFAALFLAASTLSHGGDWKVAVALGALGASLGLIVVRRLRASPRPLIPLDLIRLAPLRHAYAASIAAFAAQMSLLVSLPFLLEHKRGLVAAEVGLIVLPMPIALGFVSPLVGRFADSRWAGWMSAIGLVILAGMLGGMAVALTSGGPLWILAAAMGASGAGFGLFQAPNNNVMLRTAPLNRAGAAGGMLAQCRLIGQTAGALLASTVLLLRGPLSTGALIAGAGCALVSAVFAMRRSPRRGAGAIPKSEAPGATYPG